MDSEIYCGRKTRCPNNLCTPAGSEERSKNWKCLFSWAKIPVL